ncbi:putative bacteriocin [Streptococcus pyogenes]|nr:putative bacteriocin [Streptococcus pyogenes]VGV71785.1 putative bacteriocin [Streptococcus pyogenes]VHB42222.1 putative bacteriocin [Streptococcus pyogenes]VHB84667.1 putative bacteriocin [Streptococcus pyogenes]VHB84749.1 putative bacteriocin [Streptococcus pyogenes]
MIQNMMSFYNDHKTVIITTLIVLALLTVYPPIFSAIYESGRDFGRSIVGAFFS